MAAVQASPEARLRDVTFELDRREVFPQLVGDHRDFLIVSGLAGASKDVAALTSDGPNAFTMAGAMEPPFPWGSGWLWRNLTAPSWSSPARESY